jgi:site-specific DNA recombinase
MTHAPARQPETAGRGGDVRVGVYVRRSTDDEHQPYSIEAQDTRLAAYIGSQPGWRHAARFADDASGASTHRSGLQRALAAARAGVIDVLLVYRVDRLTRSLRDLVTLLDDLDHAGVVFRSATEPFDTATAMGRMLAQMLGMFAQFERDTIIDRVIAGMERKAAAGKWKGGRRPYGYQVSPATSTLIPDQDEAAVVRLTFGLYTTDRLGGKTIARTLNDRGHRTTTGGPWSAHQVLRVLSSRIYLGELTFRGITTTSCHPAIIDDTAFGEAQRILAARGEDHAKRAANGSDYLLTGLMRCPDCGKAMIGTRAHGRSRVYRYYTCFTRARYDTDRCNASRLDADAVEHAVISTLAGFYRDQHDLIAEAITAAQASYAAAQDGRRAELAAAEHDLAKTGAAIDRYLTAFENGALDPEDLAVRLAQLKARSAQLRARRDELAEQVAAVPTAPPAAILWQVADHIGDIVASGSHSQRKALIEVLIAQIKITGPGRIVAVFRIPQPPATDQPGASADPATTSRATAEDPVRAMTNLVELRGLEPLTPCLQSTRRQTGTGRDVRFLVNGTAGNARLAGTVATGNSYRRAIGARTRPYFRSAPLDSLSRLTRKGGACAIAGDAPGGRGLARDLARLQDEAPWRDGQCPSRNMTDRL